MEYTTFKDTKISRLGFGTMRLPMDQDGNIDYAAGQEMLDYALANGINYIDTAYKYHDGESENFVGAAIKKHPRDSFCLADKMPHWLCAKEEDVDAIFADQLKKCGTDYFDFYLLHNLDEESYDNVQKLRIFDLLQKKQEAGQIRHLGASFHCSPEFLRQVLTEHGSALEFVQLQLNYFDWEYQDAKALYDVAAEFDKPVVVMEPIRGGMLAKPMSEDACAILDAAGTGASYPSFALRFVDQLPMVCCTLSGMSTLDQMKENIEIFNGPVLSEAEKAAIGKAVKKLRADILIPCTGCNYCSECPAGIKIPKLFHLYNEAAAKGFHHIWGSLSGAYKEAGPNTHDCIGCGNCESHCPQKISIIQLLKDIDAKYAELAEIGE